jgi:hypothetical protein
MVRGLASSCLSFFFLGSVSSYISQINPIGDVPWIYGNVTLIGGESECVPFIAEGTIHTIAMRLFYSPLREILALDTDLLLSIATTTELWEIRDCISYGGYQLQYNYCMHDSYWNSSLWRTTPPDGSGRRGVEGYVDFSPYQLRNDDQYWLFCVSNGWLGSATKVHYELSVVFYNSDITVTGYASGLSPTRSPTPSPTLVSNSPPTSVPTATSQPTPFYPNHDTAQYLTTLQPTAITCSTDPSSPPSSSSSSEGSSDPTIEIVYRLQLASQQQRCLQIPTFSPLSNITFSLSKLSVFENIYSSISDVSLSITELLSSSSIQIGGRYLLTDADRLQAVVAWPDSWTNIDIFDIQTVTLSLEVDTDPLPSSSVSPQKDFLYEICFVNTFLNASVPPSSTAYTHLPDNKIWYEGTLTLHNSSYNCALPSLSSLPSPAPTPAPSPPAFPSLVRELSAYDEVSTFFFNLTLSGGDSRCLNAETSGLLSSLSLNLSFKGNGDSWASDLLMTIETPAVGDKTPKSCEQYGGVSSNVNFQDCTWIGVWGNSLNRPNSGSYSTVGLVLPSVTPHYGYAIRQVWLSNLSLPLFFSSILLPLRHRLVRHRFASHTQMPPLSL